MNLCMLTKRGCRLVSAWGRFILYCVLGSNAWYMKSQENLDLAPLSYAVIKQSFTKHCQVHIIWKCKKTQINSYFLQYV